MFKIKVNARTVGRTDGRTHNGHRAMTLACWPTASGAKNLSSVELKTFIFQLREYPCNITHDILFLIYNGYF